MGNENHGKLPQQSVLGPAPGAGLETLPPEAQQRLGEILERYLAELEAGRRPDLVRLAAEHPDLGEHLKLYAASLDFLQQAAGGIAVEERSGPAAAGLPFGQLGDYQILGEIGRGGKVWLRSHAPGRRAGPADGPRCAPAASPARTT